MIPQGKEIFLKCSANLGVESGCGRFDSQGTFVIGNFEHVIMITQTNGGTYG